MEIAGFALAVIGFLLAAGVWFHSSKLQAESAAEMTKLESKIVRVETRSKQAEAKAQAMSSRARELERELAEAVARRDEKAMASAMWQLELERSYRQWSDVIVPDPSSSRPNEATTGQQLTFAISQEVERLREEVGVSIRFDGALNLELDAETALGGLRISEELLAQAAKSADDVSVSIFADAEYASMSVIVDCVGWETNDDPGASELNATVQGMAAKLDGWVHWSREGDDHLVIHTQLPVSPEAAINLVQEDSSEAEESAL